MTDTTNPSTPVEDAVNAVKALRKFVSGYGYSWAVRAILADRERLLDKLECATHERDEAQAALTAAGRNLDELRRVCAEILHEDLEKWPAHGNVSLAIASALQLAKLRSIPDSEGGA